MHVFRRLTPLPDVSPETIWSWHMHTAAFNRLLPPWHRLDILKFPDPIDIGGEAEFVLRLGPLRLPWDSTIIDLEPGVSFLDRSRRGPFSSWSHQHRFVGEDGSGQIEDEVHWELPLEPPSRWIAGSWAHTQIAEMFAWRHRVTVEDLAAHARFPRKLRVGVTGATGLVGRELTDFLRAGDHTVIPFVRGERREQSIRWDPATGLLDPAELEGLDAVVHLAGEPIAGRWTVDKKERIRRSRVDGTALLASAMARCARPPPVLVCASAIGVYGPEPREVDESSELGTGFLAEVGAAWEAAARPATDAGVRTVHLRLGLVWSGRGGVLATLAPLFQWGLGGPLGDGEFGQCGVALDDVLDVTLHALQREDLSGPYNVVAPQPVRQHELAATLGTVLGRPACLPAPASAVAAVLGEMGREIALGGALVRPTRLLQAGYRWRRPDLEDTLRAELGRTGAI